MHEYSIVQALYDRVAAEAAARRASSVHRVTVRIGEISGVDVGLLQTAWTTFRVRTCCEHAPLEVEVVPAEWVCRSCGTEVPRGGVLVCPRCGSAAKLSRGDDIVLQRVEMEVGDV
jgi:hydrogenase nickel incorporation protein HypA/HybF